MFFVVRIYQSIVLLLKIQIFLQISSWMKFNLLDRSYLMNLTGESEPGSFSLCVLYYYYYYFFFKFEGLVWVVAILCLFFLSEIQIVRVDFPLTTRNLFLFLVYLLSFPFFRNMNEHRDVHFIYIRTIRLDEWCNWLPDPFSLRYSFSLISVP